MDMEGGRERVMKAAIPAAQAKRQLLAQNLPFSSDANWPPGRRCEARARIGFAMKIHCRTRSRKNGHFKPTIQCCFPTFWGTLGIEALN